MGLYSGIVGLIPGSLLGEIYLKVKGKKVKKRRNVG